MVDSFGEPKLLNDLPTSETSRPPICSLAHELQICNNWKDPGVWYHAQSKTFKMLRDQMNSVFVDLPPPKPNFGALVFVFIFIMRASCRKTKSGLPPALCGSDHWCRRATISMTSTGHFVALRVVYDMLYVICYILIFFNTRGTDQQIVFFMGVLRGIITT